MSDQLKEESPVHHARLLPAENYTSSDPAVPVKLRIAKEGVASLDPMSVPDLLNRTVRDYADHTAMVFRNAQKQWQRVTYRWAAIQFFKSF